MPFGHYVIMGWIFWIVEPNSGGNRSQYMHAKTATQTIMIPRLTSR